MTEHFLKEKQAYQELFPNQDDKHLYLTWVKNQAGKILLRHSEELCELLGWLHISPVAPHYYYFEEEAEFVLYCKHRPVIYKLNLSEDELKMLNYFEASMKEILTSKREINYQLLNRFLKTNNFYDIIKLVLLPDSPIHHYKVIE